MTNRLAPILALALVLAVPACAQRPRLGSVYRWAESGDVPSLDPIQIADTQSHDAGNNIYEGLVTYRPAIHGSGESLYDIVPALAERWEVSPDRRTYTFHLRQATFHNGRPVEAADVKAGIERLANPKNASKGLWTIKALTLAGVDAYQAALRAGKPAQLSSVTVLDPRTVSITLDQPIPFALHILAMPLYYVAPRELTAKWGQDFGTHAVGTGPYRLSEWVRGQRLVMTRYPGYWGQKPPIERLEMLVVPSDDAKFLKFEAGDLEHVEPIPAGQFSRVIHDSRWNPVGAAALRQAERLNDPAKSLIIKTPEPTTNYLGFNVTQEPFTDVRVRQAFNYAVNKLKITNRVWGGRGLPAVGVLPPDFPGFDASRKPVYPYDPEKAKALLEAAGWKAGADGLRYKDGKPLQITLWYNQDDLWAATSAAVQADLRQVGVDCTVQAQLWQPYLEKIRKGEAAFFRFGWHADYPDPDNFLWTVFSKANLDQDNTSRYDNPNVNAWLDQARQTTDWPTRQRLYHQAEDQIIADAPWLFLLHRVTYKIVQPYVQGQQIHPITKNVMTEVSLAPAKGS